MRLADLSAPALGARLRGSGVFFRIGPFTFHLRGDLPRLTPLLSRLYGLYPLAADETFADFHVALIRPKTLRRWWRPEAHFFLDGAAAFSGFALAYALPYLEWGLNWCVTRRGHNYLMLHAGVVEKHGRALLLPAWPGSGKSTLCAALCHRGWRLLSDEFALVRPADLALVPFPRLIPLKNQSVAVIREFAPEAVLGPVFYNTRKGDLAHLRPPPDSVGRAAEHARAALIVFPQFMKDAPLRLLPLARERAFMKLSGNSFNYEVIGPRGFEAMSGLIGTCSAWLLHYGDLDAAVAQLDALVEQPLSA